MEERPIDRGWAWVVCFGVAVNTLFFSGPLRTYGILFVEIRNRFNTSGTITSIVLAMISVGMSITSPGAATLGERYGQRKIIVFGGFLMFLAAFLTSFAPNVIYIAIVFGSITGLGLGCVFTPSIVMIGYYFNRRRSLANGISSAGGSIGQLTIPVLFTYLLDKYSFQGGLLIFSALLLHVIPASMLLRPVTCYLPLKPKSDNAEQNADKTEQNTDNMQHDANESVLSEDDKELTVKYKNPRLTDKTNEELRNSLPSVNPESPLSNRLSSRKSPKSSFRNLLRTRQGDETASLHAYPRRLDSERTDEELSTSLNIINSYRQSRENLSRHGSTYFLPMQQMSVEEPVSPQVPPVDSEDEEDDAKTTHHKQNQFTKMLCFCCKLYDWNLFRDKVFVLYSVSMTLSHTGYSSICMFLPPFAEEKGIGKYEIALLLSIAGAVTFFGRIGGGWFADLKYFERPNLAGSCLIVVGSFAALLPIFPIYPYMIVFACVLGFVGGTFVAQVVSVVIDLMGLDKMSSSLGLSLMVSGMVTIPVPLLLGLLRDISGSFDWSVALCSVFLIVGGSMIIVTQQYKSRRDRITSK